MIAKSSTSQPARPSVVDSSISGPVILSIILHAIVAAIILFGAPHFIDDAIVYDQPVTIEIANIDQITQTDRAPLDAPKPERKASKPQPQKPSEPQPQPVASKPKPEPKVAPPEDIAAPQTPPEPEPIAQDESNDAVLAQITPDSDQPKEEIAKKKIANPPPPIAKKPRPPQTKTAEKKKEEPKKEDKKNIDNLLISLVGDEEPVLQDLKPVDPKKDEPQKSLDDILNAEISADLAAEQAEKDEKPSPTPAPQIARFSDRLTISEQDALRQQLGQCWNVLAGARDADDLVVQIRLTVRPDRTVSSATLINNNRYNSDGVYRAAADAALRAVRNPLCSPLALPADKYDQWKVITVRFDPRNMF